MNELTKVFGQAGSAQVFDHIRISIASPDRIHSWSFGEIKKPKPSITGPSNRKGTAYSAPAYLVRQRITNACAENTSV